jgi:cephalosporin-C deacetylase-like acetyl esterase
LLIVDVYRALELLSRRSRIDSGKIALLGISRGG